MKKETTTIRRRSNPNSTATVKGGRVKLYSLMFVCVLVVVSGLFFAARQHFSSVDYSMRNSKLRKQLDDLESEKRRLLLAREVSLSPAEIKKTARKLGIDNSAAAAQVASATRTAKPATPELASAKAVDGPQYVVRTAYVESTARAAGTAKPAAAKKAPSAVASLTRSAE